MIGFYDKGAWFLAKFRCDFLPRFFKCRLEPAKHLSHFGFLVLERLNPRERFDSVAFYLSDQTADLMQKIAGSIFHFPLIMVVFFAFTRRWDI
jgi:hypothetical protein